MWWRGTPQIQVRPTTKGNTGIHIIIIIITIINTIAWVTLMRRIVWLVGTQGDGDDWLFYRPMVSQLSAPKIPEGERVDFDASIK